MLSRAGRLTSLLRAVGQAAESGTDEQTNPATPDVPPPKRADQPREGDATLPAEPKPEQTGLRIRHPEGVAAGRDEPNPAPPLIEFDPHRAALAYRIANAQRRSLRRPIHKGSVPAKND